MKRPLFGGAFFVLKKAGKARGLSSLKLGCQLDKDVSDRDRGF